MIKFLKKLFSNLDADVYEGAKKVVLRSLSGDNLDLSATSVKLLTLDGDIVATKEIK